MADNYRRFREISFSYALGGDADCIYIPRSFYDRHGPFDENRIIVRDPKKNELTIPICLENGFPVLRQGLQLIRDFYGVHGFFLLRFKFIVGNQFDIIIEDGTWNEIIYPDKIPTTQSVNVHGLSGDTVHTTTVNNVHETSVDLVQETNVQNVQDTNVDNLEDTNVDNLQATNVDNVQTPAMGNLSDYTSTIHHLQETNVQNVQDINVDNLQATNVYNVQTSAMGTQRVYSSTIHRVRITKCLASARQTLNVPVHLAKTSFTYRQQQVILEDEQGVDSLCDIRWCRYPNRRWQCALAGGWYSFVRRKGLVRGDQIGLQSTGVGNPVRVFIYRGSSDCM